jgi:crotonobetainyl-CoA:carnitine CoA-transferase CaiB-like acyl-CoA transferase
MLAEYEHPRLGTVRSVGTAVFMSDHTPRHHAGPSLGADGPAILSELAYAPEEIDRLRAQGAFGDPGGTAKPAAGDGA